MAGATLEIIEAQSPDQRRPDLRRDLWAIALVAVTLLMTVSIVTRDPADPIETPVWPVSAIYQPDALVYPTNPGVTNACGYWGALAASMLLDAVGLAAALVVAAGGGVATAILIRGKLNAPVLRSLGGCCVIVATATAASLVDAPLLGMPVVGAGGALGAMTSAWLLEHFAPVGGWILTLTTLAAGLLLTTDYALLYAGQKVVASCTRMPRQRIGGMVAALPGRALGRFRVQPLSPGVAAEQDGGASTTLSTSPGQAILDVNHVAETEAEQPHQPRIRFRGKAVRDAVSEPGVDDVADVIATAASLAVSAPDQTEPSSVPDVDDDSDDTQQYDGEYEEGDWEDDDAEAEGVAREIEIDGEATMLRQDPPHPLLPTPHAAPRVKIPKKKDERQELYAAVREAAPDGSEDYVLPSIELLEAGDDVCYDEQLDEVRRKAELLVQTFQNFGFNIRVVEIETGPVIALYEIDLEAGLRLSKITGLADDIAIALRVSSVRIVAPIPGKNTVGIEVPNEVRQVVRLRDVIEEADTQLSKMNIPVFLGKDVSGNPMVVDLAKMPHLLIAGRTGTGKSVCLNAIITSVLMCCRPDEVRMLMIDPKMVELSGYGRLPHLMHPVITDMKKAEAILAWAVEKMEERYSLLAKVGVRHINSFNDLGREEIMRRLEIDESDGASDIPDKLPFIVIVADEMADLMMTAGKDVETHIIRLAQKSRAVGIHLILATQKPTVDVITGLIKSNLPARLSFQVASKTDSRVVLDENGADKLLGNGDMLFLWPGTSTLIRGQGTYLSDDEIDAVVEHCSMGEQHFIGELMNLKVDDEGGDEGELNVDNLRKRDELYESAIEVVIREQRGSISLIQRCLGIGYGRAARLIDFMEEDGIVSAYNGQKSRQVIVDMQQWRRMQGLDPDDEQAGDDGIIVADRGVDDSATTPPPKRSKRTAAKADVTPGTDDHDDADGEYVDWDE